VTCVVCGNIKIVTVWTEIDGELYENTERKRVKFEKKSKR